MTEPAAEPDAGFFLGRKYDPAAHATLDEKVYYEPRDLTTHGVVVAARRSPAEAEPFQNASWAPDAIGGDDGI